MPTRLRRTELSTPGSNEKMMVKAAASVADVVMLDLEDSVAPSEKASARAKIVHALTTLDWGKKTRAVRINPLDTAYAYRDIIEIVEPAHACIDVLIVPKIKSVRDVWWVDTLLTQIETQLGTARRIGLEVLIEEVEAMIQVEEIARASPRLEALIFGPGDYAASQGMDVKNIGDAGEYPGDIFYYARNKIVIAARAAGLDMIDGPFAAFADPDGLRRECIRARALGAVGKWVIHPSQIDIVNELFAPSREQVDRARRLAAAYAAASASGNGAVNVDGVMVDAASVRLLRKTIELAEQIGM